MKIGAWTSAVVLAVAVSGCEKKTDQPQEPAVKEPAAENAAPAGDSAKPASSIVSKEVSYEADGLTLKGYLAYDEAIEGKRPGVLVVHEWWGHNDYARMRARMLAEMGYTALAVDMFGDGKQAAHPDDAMKFVKEVNGNAEIRKKRFEAARTFLEQQETTNPDKTAAIGYCFGGGVVLSMARAGSDLAGVASFHGSLEAETPAKKGDIKTKILVLHGEADPFVTPQQVEAFKKEMAQAGADLEFHGYPGATHAFTNPDATANGKTFDLPLAYDEEADRESWNELREFLAEVFAAEP